MLKTPYNFKSYCGPPAKIENNSRVDEQVSSHGVAGAVRWCNDMSTGNGCTLVNCHGTATIGRYQGCDCIAVYDEQVPLRGLAGALRWCDAMLDNGCSRGPSAVPGGHRRLEDSGNTAVAASDAELPDPFERQ